MALITLANGTILDTSKDVIAMAKPAKKVSKPKGFVLYRGASVLDGADIVVIATMDTANVKTGNMIQTWILRADMSPLEASKKMLDSSVCGNCPHRRNLNGGCYVTLHQAPRAVYASFEKGNYPDYEADKHAHFFKDRSIRLGAYGDPAAVPVKVWEEITKECKNWTGYTHQLGHKNFDNAVLNFCQVSADTEKQAQKAHKLGYKTFRVKTENMPKLDNEIECLADTKNLSCLECGLCDGKKANVVINVHGQLNKRFADKFERII